jgi:hypothetical protein
LDIKIRSTAKTTESARRAKKKREKAPVLRSETSGTKRVVIFERKIIPKITKGEMLKFLGKNVKAKIEIIPIAPPKIKKSNACRLFSKFLIITS